MKILHVVTSSQIAGVELYALRLAGLQKGAHDPFILAPKGISSERYRAADIELFHPPSGQAGFFSMRRGMQETAARIGKVDVVHIHSDAEHCLSARQYFPDAAVVFRCSGNIGFGFWLAARAINRWADMAMAIAHADVESFRRAGVSDEKLRLIHNGVPDLATTEAGRAELSRSLDLSPDRNIIVSTLARLVRLKGLDVLIRAASRVAANHPDVRFVMAGEGDEREALEVQARKLGVFDVCRFPGVISNTGDLLGISNIYAHPARHEPFGLAVAEGMSAGLPVVATKVGGIVDQVVEGETGHLVDKDDADSLAEAIVRLIENPKAAARMGAAGRARQAELFSLAGMNDKIEHLYADALRARDRRV